MSAAIITVEGRVLCPECGGTLIHPETDSACIACDNGFIEDLGTVDREDISTEES